MGRSITSAQLVNTIDKLVLLETKNNNIVYNDNEKVLVGPLTILKNNEFFDIFKKNEKLASFENKIIAFEYARNFPRTKYKKIYLTSIDRKLSRLKVKASIHSQKFKQAKKIKNKETMSAHLNIISECRYNINLCISSAAKFSKYKF